MQSQLDLIPCRKQPGTHVGQVCSKCEGKCPICESLVNPCKLVYVCDDCAFGSLANKCILCGSSNELADAYYCKECCLLERDRDGCPRILNVGSTRTSSYFDRRQQQAANDL